MSTILLLILLIVFSTLFVACFFIFFFMPIILPYFFWGAIYVPTAKNRIDTIVSFAENCRGLKVADLGSGDGRLLVAFAKKGAVVFGYEINPFLVSKSRKNIIKEGLENKAFVFNKSFWHQDLSGFDVIVVYGMVHVMGRLEKKMQRELKNGARVVSHAFVFPHWNCVKKENNIYLYIK
ncbi:MAG: hypothetical protein A2998_03270 [Candidatus Staskawiczbacteria bacterium RIFCSPLOWO2_01_FULL_37_25b]|uniref:Methyltransferase domain-containing protein n=2 Tax=Candidatus Staskawicziibacteriota TaxID=1817916 RepID=A0A1G2HLU1_9BACT|nr:MAG: hypothetical protein A2812_03130 [Candidatus Staskawiczbacteria bacterium RIFCSPHIGHO2_01_FULL_36_16]OGZ71743.1 MAG: hypothetical protein A2998_03270 [Candidatus Staskawiczbacteria bacterium RIFCSPLOWO2_01_FULL_37_25b]